MSDALTGPIIIGLSSLLGATVAAFLLWLGTRRKVYLDDLQARYDQMQEDVDRERSARIVAENAFRAEITGLRIEMVGLRVEVRVRDDYIGRLRRHISDGLGPPPEDWPAALTNGSGVT
jgi:hypothetical protein